VKFHLARQGKAGARPPMNQDIDVFIGLDVGKSSHHAVALDKAGMKLFDSRLTKTVEAPLAAHSRRSCGPRTS
jgi:hypothetical protein